MSNLDSLDWEAITDPQYWCHGHKQPDLQQVPEFPRVDIFRMMNFRRKKRVNINCKSKKLPLTYLFCRNLMKACTVLFWFLRQYFHKVKNFKIILKSAEINIYPLCLVVSKNVCEWHSRHLPLFAGLQAAGTIVGKILWYFYPIFCTFTNPCTTKRW